ncbi:hypothetical protein C2S51_037519 [Perilla frutescens var. frutescens]|nr:hypothetical protein C2S51_037519 [Perilla frutescens var. frutescens]
MNVCLPGYGVFDTLLIVLMELDMLKKARQCFLRMKDFRVSLKERSCDILLHKYSKIADGVSAKKFFHNMIGAGIIPSIYIYNIMIGIVYKEGDLKAAKCLFVRMKEMVVSPDVVTYNSRIDGHGKLGELSETKLPLAFNFARKMKETYIRLNVVTYITFVDSFCKEGMWQYAIKFFVNMRRIGLTPNEFTYTSLIDANFKVGNFADALKFVKEMVEALKLNVVTYTTLLDGLCKEGKIHEAEESFKGHAERRNRS